MPNMVAIELSLFGDISLRIKKIEKCKHITVGGITILYHFHINDLMSVQ